MLSAVYYCGRLADTATLSLLLQYLANSLGMLADHKGLHDKLPDSHFFGLLFIYEFAESGA